MLRFIHIVAYVSVSSRITSCTLYTCDHGIPNTSLYTCMFMCECNVNHHRCSMHIQTYSRRCPCTHTCGNYMHNIQHSYAFDMHLRFVKLLLLTFLRQDSADRTERNMLETKTVHDNEYHVHNIKVNDGQSAEFTYTSHNK